MALQHFIRVFVDSDGTAKGDVCHYGETGNMTGTDDLESHIVSEIQSLVKEKDAAPVDEKPDEPLKGKLPADFPGHAALDKAGVHTYNQLRKALADEVKIPGIGEAATAKILEALGSEETD